MTLDLEPIKARTRMVSMAPWTAPGLGYVMSVGHYVARDVGKSDAEFIAHAREDIPALITEVERLRAGRAS